MRRLLFFLTTLFLIPVALAQAPDRIELLRQEITELEQTLGDLELWGEMQFASGFVASRDSRCWTYLEMAQQSREELVALNEQYRGRADAEYRRQAEILQSDNRNAVEEYRSCFGSVVSGRFPIINRAGVAAYQPFLGRYNQLADMYGEGEVNTRMQQVRDRLAQISQALAMEEGDRSVRAGTITSTFREVEVFRDGRWIEAQPGMTLSVTEEIRTGPRGRVRIEMNDRDDATNTGPTVLNIGSGSHVVMETFDLSNGTRERNGVVDLIRGTLRAFTYGYGGRAAFSVRVGTSICGIRGTEVTVTYDPDEQNAAFWVDHGDAFMQTAAGMENLVPGEVTQLRAGQKSVQRRFSPGEYASLSEATAVPVENSQPLTLTRIVNEGQRLESPGFLTANSSMSAREMRLLGAHNSALSDFISLMEAYNRGDFETIMRHTTSQNREMIRQALADRGREAIMATESLPREWRVDCMTCVSESNCDVFVEMDHTTSPGVFRIFNYVMEVDRAAAEYVWIVSGSKPVTEEQYDAAVAACPAEY